MATPFSIVIMSFNEEAIIESCLKAAAQVTDDIVLVDSGSTDRTIEISKKYTSNIHYNAMDTYGSQKNFGAEKAKHDWVFALDCDEILNEELISYLNNVELKNGHIYKLCRHTFIGGKAIHHSGMTPDWINRLYHRKESAFDDYLVHERLIGFDTMPMVKMKGFAFHYSYEDLKDLTTKYDKYAQLGAKNRLINNIRPSLLQVSLGPLFRFLKTYLWQRGFMDGKIGLQLSIEGARMVRKRWKYYYQLEKSYKKE